MLARFTLLLTALLGMAVAEAQIYIPVPYGVATTVELTFLDEFGYPLEGEVDGDGTGQSDTVTLSCGGSTPVAATNSYTETVGGGYTLDLEATELECPRIRLVVAASEPQTFLLETYGHASAQHPTMGWLTGDAYARIGDNGAGLTDVGGLSTNAQADIRSAVGLGSANLDTQLSNLPTAAENAEAVGQHLIDGDLTLEDAVCYIAAILVNDSDFDDTNEDSAEFLDPTGMETRVTVVYSGTNMSDRTVTLGTCDN